MTYNVTRLDIDGEQLTERMYRQLFDHRERHGILCFGKPGLPPDLLGRVNVPCNTITKPEISGDDENGDPVWVFPCRTHHVHVIVACNGDIVTSRIDRPEARGIHPSSQKDYERAREWFDLCAGLPQIFL